MMMTWFINFLIVFLLQVFISWFALAISNITSDETALLALKSHISHDPHNLLTTNWSTTTPVCSWIGVTCGAFHPSRVTALNLSSMDLNGTIPPQIGNLSFLAFLSIRENNFHGYIPSELSSLRLLKFLDFGFNFFSGNIPPCIGSLPKLESLSLEANYFVGNLQLSSWNSSSLQNINVSHNQVLGFLPFNIFNASSLQSIDLSFSSLSATLPMDVFSHLPKLQELYLSGNEFYGELPSSLFKCTQLQILSLSDNKFTGSIPAEIGNLTMLKKLHLHHNDLSGKIPQEIGYLAKMENLSMSHNHLSGSIPGSVRNCTLLKEINFIENNLSGAIPPEISDLRSLEILRISDNVLNGDIPSALFNISMMKVIAINANHLSGNLPLTTGISLPNLMELRLAGNELNGIVPSAISNASLLTFLDLSDNSFTGYVPKTFGNLRYLQGLSLANNILMSESSTPESGFLSSLTNCKYLRKIVLSGNPLNATLPISIGNLSTSLQEFRANNCNSKGSIPREIGNLTNLIALSLENNELSDTIPTTVGRLKKLQGLFLQGNNLEGAITHDLCQLDNLVDLSLGGNKLSGHIPECFGNLTTLRHLNLSSNNLNSRIPFTLWSLADILAINLSSNFLIGSLPLGIKNLQVVTEIDMSRNQLSGEIPISIGDLKSITYLSLANNGFQGPIPLSLNHSISLEFLDLSCNKLSGVIPKSLEALLYLKYFNVSFNGLQGEIPDGGCFRNFSARSYMMNKALCGLPQLQVPPCKTGVLKLVPLLKVILPLIALIALAFYTFTIIWLTCYKKRITSMIDWLELIPLRGRLTYDDLKQATDNFSRNNLLGIGSFGSVYKGSLKRGLVVAIKVFNVGEERSLRSFDVECEITRCTRHRNLIKILSSCACYNFKALVMEYMSNGSLEKWLYTHNYHLDILQRLDIMIDVASVIKYLHYDHSATVIHCDLKPGNVLLDEDMIAHVSDFSIAKIVGSGSCDSTAQSTVMGTIGYMAPEYGLYGIVSTKSDVYSFGILLMETFTGKKPTDEMFGGEISLRHWVTESIVHDLQGVIDPCLLQIESEYFEAKMECLSSIMGLALHCSADLANERLDMEKVLNRLYSIKELFLYTTLGDE